MTNNLDGINIGSAFNLTPYVEPKPWYEIESNFPCLMYSEKQNNSFMDCKDMEAYLRWNGGNGGYRLATNEEIDSLKINDNK